MKTRYFTGKGPRKQPLQPLGPKGPTFHDLREGDRVTVAGSDRTGTIVSDNGVHGEKKVRWDNPVFGVVEGWVAWPNLEPKEDA